MERSLWYASPQRLFSVIPAAKTRTSRLQLRRCAAKLSHTEHVPAIQHHAKRTRSNATIIRLPEHEPVLRDSIHVAGSSSQLFSGWTQAQMGSWEHVDARSANVQTRSLMAEKAMLRLFGAIAQSVLFMAVWLEYLGKLAVGGCQAYVPGGMKHIADLLGQTCPWTTALGSQDPVTEMRNVAAPISQLESHKQQQESSSHTRN